jgi:signal recognition particle subunit SRP54
MLESLSEKLNSVFQKFGSHRILTEEHIDEGMREIRLALLAADVNLTAIKSFVAKVKERALGEEIVKNTRPKEMLISIVYEELEALMGPVSPGIPYEKKAPTIVMMAGLQGSGKTTTCGKLALRLQKREGKKPLLVAADVQRPAAIEQLKTLGKQLGIPVYSEETRNPVQICKNSLEFAVKNERDVIILDTAGRLHIDDVLMDELRKIAEVVKPHQIYLVCDAMVGQDAARSAQVFNEKLELDGIILTKLDGDARGGAALSVKTVTGKPIKFSGVGEKLEDLEEFNPKQMTDRILGMGDIVQMVNLAKDHFNQEEQEATLRKMLKNEFTLVDFLDQMKKMEKLGSMKNLMKMIPGMGELLNDEMMSEGEKHMKKVKTIINSMTPQERVQPDILNKSRKLRIAKGSHVEIKDVNDLMREFKEMRKMMKGMFSGGDLNIPGMNLPGLQKGLSKLMPKEFTSSNKITEAKLQAFQKKSQMKHKK